MITLSPRPGCGSGSAWPSASLRRRALAATAATLTALALSTAGSGAASADDTQQVPVVSAEGAQVVSGQYIVVMRPGANAIANRIAAAADARNNGAQILNEYSTALQGFAAKLPQRALDALRGNHNVEYIEADQIMSIDTTQSPATWGLDRVDQRNLPLSHSYSYTVTGAGVTAYIIDTGIRFSHNEFGGRAASGYDAIDGGTADDCNGHGTHVSGTVGGSTYGLAKAVSIVGVRVLNCRGSGTNSQVIAGIDWVTDDHGVGELAVANMSLGGSASNALDRAVRRSIADGVTYAIAAGNDNGDACNQSPARVTEAITVGASTKTDARSSFSNKGDVRGHFRTRIIHQVGLEHQRHRDQQDQWYVDGLATCGRCCGAVPATKPLAHAGSFARPDRESGNHGGPRERGRWFPKPAALHTDALTGQGRDS